MILLVVPVLRQLCSWARVEAEEEDLAVVVVRVGVVEEEEEERFPGVSDVWEGSSVQVTLPRSQRGSGRGEVG